MQSNDVRVAEIEPQHGRRPPGRQDRAGECRAHVLLLLEVVEQPSKSCICIDVTPILRTDGALPKLIRLAIVQLSENAGDHSHEEVPVWLDYAVRKSGVEKVRCDPRIMSDVLWPDAVNVEASSENHGLVLKGAMRTEP